MKRLRIPAVAGAFYSEDPEILQKDVNRFLEKASPPEIKGEIKAIVVPHAGYIYSGQVAAYSYKAVKGRNYSAVIVIAPSHFIPFYGASIYKGDGYQIPTGIVPIHQELSQRLLEQDEIIHFVSGAHIKEHSLEVQLPFLRTVLPGFQLVPMIMGSQDLSSCRKIADAIVAVAGDENILIVASSDLSHYYSYSEAVKLDKIIQEFINDFDPEGLASAIGKGACEACGAGPIITAMLAAKKMGADKGQVMHYANSGDVSGNRAQVVGYMAAAFSASKTTKPHLETEAEKADMGLTEDDKKLLHEIAKTTIEKSVKGEPVPSFEVTAPILEEKRGGFVTIKKQGHLRGCIGYIHAYKPLYQTIEEMAKAAALNDPRFSPVQAKELPELELEISVLTPMILINNIEEIEVGKHGLYIQQGRRSGLLLPQVATEYNWDRLTFLQQTCVKAGLPTNAWQEEDTRIYIFSADIF